MGGARFVLKDHRSSAMVRLADRGGRDGPVARRRPRPAWRCSARPRRAGARRVPPASRGCWRSSPTRACSRGRVRDDPTHPARLAALAGPDHPAPRARAALACPRRWPRSIAMAAGCCSPRLRWGPGGDRPRGAGRFRGARHRTLRDAVRGGAAGRAGRAGVRAGPALPWSSATSWPTASSPSRSGAPSRARVSRWRWSSPTCSLTPPTPGSSPRRRRMMISLAGPACDIVAGGRVCAGAAWSRAPGGVRDVLFQVAFGGYVGALFNLNPLMERDGYHVLVDLLSRAGAAPARHPSSARGPHPGAVRPDSAAAARSTPSPRWCGRC